MTSLLVPDSGLHRPIVGLIATKNPTLALAGTVKSLFDGGACAVVVVNDGSDEPESADLFKLAEKSGATIIHLPENVGKSAALRTGYRSFPDHPRIIIAQTDDDTVAGDLRIPAAMIEAGKADIVDIRVETFDGRNLIGLTQQLDYWIINAFIKRLQDWLRARLWLSGASVMYTYDAAKVMLLPKAHSRTEDTEGRFRAIGAGLRLRYCSAVQAQFKTMVPESVTEVRHQWKRWALGNGQVLKVHGLGGGSKWIATVNLLSWAEMLLSPIAQFFTGRLLRLVPSMPQVPGVTELMAAAGPVGGSLISGILWMAVFGILMGIAGAIMLRRPALLMVGIFVPLLSLGWTAGAIEGLIIAQRHPRAETLSWTPPTRMAVTPAEVTATKA
jgi:hypothetical protein